MYSDKHRQILLNVARQSIDHGLKKGRPSPVNVGDFDAELAEHRATFVTLKLNGELRGCIGMLEAVRPLVADVSDNAFAAAFKDGRFSPMTIGEFQKLSLSISILSPAEPVLFSSEQDLLTKIRPGVDGLILRDGYHRGTFLPSVWEQVGASKEFLFHLKIKAGLPGNYWSDSIKIERYTTESF
ncbi:MAG: AmmeMemoRadiSam system protein A [Deltaproteobacteria bacterium]|nr:AmmeMemoRadiSam system protein A [Deltaproteobacteria bacterium]